MPVPSIEIQQLARAFFAEAQRDLGDAKVLQNAKRKAAVMTSCQHAVEKALKTIYTLAKDRRPPMTHTMRSEIDKIFPNFQENVLRQRLTRWVIYLEQIVPSKNWGKNPEYPYYDTPAGPVRLPSNSFTNREAKACISATERLLTKVRRFCNDRIKVRV